MSDMTQTALADVTIDYIRKQLAETGMSLSTLSDLTMVSKDTIKNILYRKIAAPSFETLSTLVYALGGSID